MRWTRFLVATAGIMLGVAAVMPLLTAPAEQTARAVRNHLAVQADSLAASLAAARRTRDTVRTADELAAVRERLTAADSQLARVQSSRARHWSWGGPGMILAAFAGVLGLAAVLVRRR